MFSRDQSGYSVVTETTKPVRAVVCGSPTLTAATRAVPLSTRAMPPCSFQPPVAQRFCAGVEKLRAQLTVKKTSTFCWTAQHYIVITTQRCNLLIEPEGSRWSINGGRLSATKSCTEHIG